MACLSRPASHAPQAHNPPDAERPLGICSARDPDHRPHPSAVTLPGDKLISSPSSPRALANDRLSARAMHCRYDARAQRRTFPNPLVGVFTTMTRVFARGCEMLVWTFLSIFFRRPSAPLRSSNGSCFLATPPLGLSSAAIDGLMVHCRILHHERRLLLQQKV